MDIHLYKSNIKERLCLTIVKDLEQPHGRERP